MLLALLPFLRRQTKKAAFKVHGTALAAATGGEALKPRRLAKGESAEVFFAAPAESSLPKHRQPGDVVEARVTYCKARQR